MDKILNIKKASILVLIVLIFTIAFVLLDKNSTSVLNFSNEITSLDQISLNLNILKQYNHPTGSMMSDFKNLFKGAYSRPEFSMLRYDLISALLIVVVPLMIMLIILLSLGVSKRTLVIIMSVFGVFTVLPLILI